MIGMMCLVLYNNQVKLAYRWYQGMQSLFRKLLAALLSFMKRKHPPTGINKRIYMNGVIHAIQIILFIISSPKVFSQRQKNILLLCIIYFELGCHIWQSSGIILCSGLRGPYLLLEIKWGSATQKAGTLISISSLCPALIFLKF